MHLAWGPKNRVKKKSTTEKWVNYYKLRKNKERGRYTIKIKEYRQTKEIMS
jgi:hypothetical protein